MPPPTVESEPADEDETRGADEDVANVAVEDPPPKYTIALSLPISDPDKVVGAPRFVILEQQTSDNEAAALERSGYQLEGVTQFIVPDTLDVIGTAVYVRRRR